MSRTTDPGLTAKIVDAAFQLFHDRGEKGLTLRATAKAAGTTPPSVYQRFPTKGDLVIALGELARQKLGSDVMKASTLEAAFRRYLAVAQQHPHIYTLVFGPNLPRILGSSGRRPMLEWFQQEFAKRNGGPGADPENKAYSALLLLHGAASMLQYAPHGAVADEIRERCLKACDALARPARHSRKAKRT